jgi:hypothetical protein
MGALDGYCEKQRPDRSGGVEDGSDAAGNCAFAKSEEAERNCIVEQRNEKQRDDEATRRQGAPAKQQDAPEKYSTKAEAKERDPSGWKTTAGDLDEDKRCSPDSGEEEELEEVTPGHSRLLIMLVLWSYWATPVGS